MKQGTPSLLPEGHYCGWTNSCTTLKPWETSGNYRGIIIPVMLGWYRRNGFRPSTAWQSRHDQLQALGRVTFRIKCPPRTEACTGIMITAWAAHGGMERRGEDLQTGVGRNKVTRAPQVLAFGSIYQGSILGAHFDP